MSCRNYVKCIYNNDLIMLMYDNDYSESGSIHDWVGDNVTDIAVTVG